MWLIIQLKKHIRVARVNWSYLLPESHTSRVGHLPARSLSLTTSVSPLQIDNDVQFQRGECVNSLFHSCLVLRCGALPWQSI